MDALNIRQKLGFLSDTILDLFYPNLCIVCEHRSYSRQELYCLDCQYQIHPTHMHRQLENAFTAHFKGRAEIESGAALYYYIKGGRLQKAIELLKYKNRPEIGLRLGRFYGNIIKDSYPYNSIDLIVPVPLHPTRQIQRGYNQSAMISIGLSESLNVPWKEDLLIRNKITNTQTEKNRLERIRNMQLVFELTKPDELTNKHVLLVDDILTTGATLEACSAVLKKGKSVRISMLTLAMAT